MGFLYDKISRRLNQAKRRWIIRFLTIDSDIIKIGTQTFCRHRRTRPCSYFVSAFCSYRLFPLFGFHLYRCARSECRKVVTTHVSMAGKENCSSDVFHIGHAELVSIYLRAESSYYNHYATKDSFGKRLRWKTITILWRLRFLR